MNITKATKIGEQCLNEMYKKSKPPITWFQIKKKYAGTEKRFYEKHILDEEIYNKICDKYNKKLTARWRTQLAWLLLDLSPKVKYKKVNK